MREAVDLLIAFVSAGLFGFILGGLLGLKVGWFLGSTEPSRSMTALERENLNHMEKES